MAQCDELSETGLTLQESQTDGGLNLYTHCLYHKSVKLTNKAWHFCRFMLFAVSLQQQVKYIQPRPGERT